ncbi:MAG: hypothetical protein AAFR65_00710 [Pseudomonadota bacterium]
MTEAELIGIYSTARTQLDAAITQLIALNFALIIAVFYFLHRSNFAMKLSVFLVYLFGWTTFGSSAAISGKQIEGAARDLVALKDAGPVTVSTQHLLDVWGSTGAIIYLVALNTVNILLVISAFFVLFFWKPQDAEKG